MHEKNKSIKGHSRWPVALSNPPFDSILTISSTSSFPVPRSRPPLPRISVCSRLKPFGRSSSLRVLARRTLAPLAITFTLRTRTLVVQRIARPPRSSLCACAPHSIRSSRAASREHPLSSAATGGRDTHGSKDERRRSPRRSAPLQLFSRGIFLAYYPARCPPNCAAAVLLGDETSSSLSYPFLLSFD